MRKLLCLLIVFIITICSFSFNVNAIEENDGILYMDNYGVCIDEYTPNYPSYSNEPQSSVNISRYDPRSSNCTTPIKDQEPHGTCGIFASIASFEMASYIQTGLKYQYSEEAVRFVLSNRLKQINNANSNFGFYLHNTTGAWSFGKVASYFSNVNNPIVDGNSVQWVAPVLLSDVPYTSNGDTPVGYWPDNMGTSNANAFVSGTECVREDLIRDKIIQYGAVYTVYNAGATTDPDSYNSSTGAWYSLTNDCNHAIAVVGWDDDYPKENFNPNRIPPGDGAWLIKNSWGTDYGEDGYGWISYYDESFNCDGEQARVVTSVEPLSKNEYMLSYDYMPMTNNKTLKSAQPNNEAYIANVYDMSSYTDEYNRINKVLFYSKNIGAIYSLYIVPLNSLGKIPDTTQLGEPILEDVITKDGYTLANLPNPYYINTEAEKYAVVIKQSSNGKIEASRESSDILNKTYYARINVDESFYNVGNDWTDASGVSSKYTYGNYCIRPVLQRATPITQNSSLSLYSTYNQGEELSVTVNLNGNQLYSIKKGTMVLYEEVDFTRNGNVITFKETFMDDLNTEKTNDITFKFTDGADQTLKIQPRQLSTVTVSGKVAQGKTLTVSATCNDGTIPPSQQLSYQWQSSTNGSTWANISGANSSSYTLTANERLKYIRCRVTISSGNGIASDIKYSASTASKVVLYGDVDLDGEITILDATAIQFHFAGITTLTDEQIEHGDFNEDGSFDIMDATAIQFYLAAGN